MKRSLFAAVAVVVIALGGLFFFLRDSGGDPGDAPTASGPTDAEVVETMKAARRAGQLDRSPAKARGRVLRATDGSAVEGALVMVRLASFQASASSQPFMTTTNATGDWSAADLPPGRYVVSTSSPGLLPGFLTDVDLQPGTETADLEVSLADGGKVLSGTVTDHRGQPLAGVRVDVMRLSDQQNATTRVMPGRTDEAGTFRLNVPPDQYHLGFYHPEHVNRSELLAVPRDRTGLQIRLAPGGVLRGRVVSRVDGTPIPRAEVRVEDPTGFMSGQGTATTLAVTTSDEQGRYELRGLASGPASLVGTARGYGSVDPTSVALGVGEVREDIDVLVDRAYSVSGFAVSKRDQTQGVPGAVIMATSFANMSASRMSKPTAKDGFFEIHGLHAGTYALMAIGDDIIFSMGDASAEVDDHDVDDVLVRLDPGAYIEGTVTPPGPGLVHASVKIDSGNFNVLQMGSLMSSMMSTMRVRRVGPDGRFRYGPVSAGEYGIEVASADGLRGVAAVEVDDENVGPLSIELSPGIEVSGVVVDPNGAAVSGVTVALHRVEENPVMDMSGFTGAAGTVDVTDEEGHFSITGLREGDYRYSIRTGRMLRIPWAEPSDPARPLAPRSLEGLKENQQLELVVNAAPPIRGVAKDPSGKPLSGVWVEAWPDLPNNTWMEAIDTGSMAATNMATTRTANQMPDSVADTIYRQMGRVYRTPPVLTDEQGRFEIEDCRLGRYVVAGLGDRGDLRGELAAVQPGTDVLLELLPQAALTVTLGGDHAPEGSYRISLEGADLYALQAREDQRSVKIPRVAPGSYRVVVEAPGGVTAQSVELEPGADVELPLTLHDWSSVSGRLVDAEGKPVSNLVVFVDRRETSLTEVMGGAQEMVAAMMGNSDRRVQSDGSFEVGRLPPGPIKIQFMQVPNMQVRGVVRADLGQAETRTLGDFELVEMPNIPGAQRGRLGLSLTIDEPAAGAASLVVQGVDAGGSAEKVGVQAGDRILAGMGLDAAKVSPELLRSRIRMVKPGTRVELHIERDGALVEPVVLVAGPPRAG